MTDRELLENAAKAARYGLVHGALEEPAQEPATLPGPGLVMCPSCCSQFDPALNRAEPQEPTGCDHCRHFAAVKCRVCGRVTA